ncbi:hypothetical protein [Pseudovibrio axinellae]|uniref:hypothetical protein n=1 Tax=Pseudovibrio axinellae TaxID=989403 RepID=UPI001113C765|nr:hypothetical protein [Pseudovibrio axinellae]
MTGLFLFVLVAFIQMERPKECRPNLTEQEMRQVLLAKMKTRSNSNVAELFPPDGSALNVGEMRVRPASHDPNDKSNSEYNLAKYEVLYTYSDFAFWALIDACGHVLMAGRGHFIWKPELSSGFWLQFNER